jgi:glutamate racemase
MENIKDYKTVILGCTHYNFIKNKISAHLKPQKILSGEFFTAKQVEKFLITTKSLVIHKRNQVLFIGENRELNRLFFEKSGQNLLN